MDLIRDLVDNFYDRTKEHIFRLTEKDPEVAHKLFAKFCQFVYYSGLDKLFLDCKENQSDPGFKIYNAEGFNKNAEIPPQVLKYIGFDGVSYGTISAEKWRGNARPRISRNSKTESMINFMGWNSEGCKKISERNRKYNTNVPLIISAGPTNNPSIKDNLEKKLEDVKKTILTFRNDPNVIEFDFNPSCPNLCISKEQFQEEASEFSGLIKNLIFQNQKFGIKVSPDITNAEIEELIKVTFEYADKYIISNITRDRRLLNSYGLNLYNHLGKGGGSGEVVYEKSFNVQKEFYEILKGTDKSIVACGGINSKERALERIKYEPQREKEIRIFTPLIFKGPKLLRELRR